MDPNGVPQRDVEPRLGFRVCVNAYPGSRPSGSKFKAQGRAAHPGLESGCNGWTPTGSHNGMANPSWVSCVRATHTLGREPQRGSKFKAQGRAAHPGLESESNGWPPTGAHLRLAQTLRYARCLYSSNSSRCSLSRDATSFGFTSPRASSKSHPS